MSPNEFNEVPAALDVKFRRGLFSLEAAIRQENQQQTLC